MKYDSNNQVITSEAKQAVLKKRALLLKTPSVWENKGQNEQDGLEFLLGDEHYYIDSSFVVEVAHLKELTPLPGTPSFLLGIFNLRGKILAVISLKKFLNLAENALTNHNRIIVLRYQDIELGILADEIIGNKTIDMNAFQSKNFKKPVGQNDLIVGVTPDGLIVFDLKKFMMDERMIINQP